MKSHARRTVPFYNRGILVDHCGIVSHCVRLAGKHGTLHTAMVKTRHLEAWGECFDGVEALKVASEIPSGDAVKS